MKLDDRGALYLVPPFCMYRPSLPVVSLKLLTWSALDPNTEALWRMNVDAGIITQTMITALKRQKHSWHVYLSPKHFCVIPLYSITLFPFVFFSRTFPIKLSFLFYITVVRYLYSYLILAFDRLCYNSERNVFNINRSTFSMGCFEQPLLHYFNHYRHLIGEFYIQLIFLSMALNLSSWLTLFIFPYT